ncbi:MAG TPA: hypothetical protein VN696_09995 [Pyrinomonadaceae bacterium]|jgi:hypothetical protein|nr:hypothetical protein [Pyrinomonadaceae bacterium]
MDEASTSHVARVILEYLHDNPDAQDTLSGIVEWWLPRQEIRTRVVKHALEMLLADALIVEVIGKDSQTHYRINDQKWLQIDRMLNH